MRKVYLYCDPRSLNDATNFYVDIILECLSNLQCETKIVHRLKDIKKPDIIFTLTERYYLIAKIKFPKTPGIYWSQGIGPEETNFIPRKIIRTISEYVIAKTSLCLFAVSEAMIIHFNKKYGYKKKSYVVMPCFNIVSPISQFNTGQYKNLTFVYAGGSSNWQCVDEMLDAYKIIEDNLPYASICILSSDKEVFKSKIEIRGIKNYDIKYVKQDHLAEELSKYKYGFLLRKDIPVNNVATPTKLNGYLASYVIPIMSDAIIDYKNKLNFHGFSIIIPCPFTPEIVAQHIIAFEREQHNFNDYRSVVKTIFNDYYNLNRYKQEIMTTLAAQI